MKKVAIFDIDGTIFRSSLFLELLEALIENNIFPEESKKDYEKQHKNWLNRKGTYEDYIEASIYSFKKHIKGIHYKDFYNIARSVVEEQKDHVYIYTRDLTKKLKNKKYYLLAISQSPLTILANFCENLGFDKVYGRIYEIGAQDRFTGKIVDEHIIANKANIVRRALLKEKLSLKDSVGVGDTEGDISLLSIVENPICFNPNVTLYRHARRMGWKVVVERKDVIYEI